MNADCYDHCTLQSNLDKAGLDKAETNCGTDCLSVHVCIDNGRINLLGGPGANICCRQSEELPPALLLKNKSHSRLQLYYNPESQRSNSRPVLEQQFVIVSLNATYCSTCIISAQC